MRLLSYLIIYLSFSSVVYSQHKVKICGEVTCEDNDAREVIVYLDNTKYTTQIDSSKKYCLTDVPVGDYLLIAYNELHKVFHQQISLTKDTVINIKLHPEEITELDDVILNSRKADFFGITKMPDYEGTSIYAGKKTEVVKLDKITANTSTNNARQVFSKISGLNIWESDAAGLQLGIGARGLSPNRTANFNVRQNGYDISADALGYPECYYMPPLEAIDEVQFVRGAASLQYGTQLGGMINFVFKEGAKDKKIEYNGRLSGGSYKFLNSFNSLGGTVGKTNYYVVYQHKRGEGFRPNTDYFAHVGYVSISHQFNPKMKLKFNYTHENYLAHQPGGLTDEQFKKDNTVSLRARNWFAVNWNLPSLNFDYNINTKTTFNWRFFTLLASRKSLGFPGKITQLDPQENRTYIFDQFRNMGSEMRVLRHYKLGKQKSTFVVGLRAYKGLDIRKQGDGNNGTNADFQFLNPDNLEKFDYRLPSKNYALFAEHIFKFNTRFSITPGVRYEFIQTNALGYVRSFQKDIFGRIIASTDKHKNSNTQFNRNILLGGAGLAYQLTKDIETYANYTTNYRAAAFSDMIVSNPNLVVDSLLKDERGYNADFGLRGFVKELIHFDVSAFYLAYENRIGETLLKTGQRYRTNIGASATKGVEVMAEIDVLSLLFGKKYASSISYYVNTSLNNSIYVKGSFENNKVENVPNTSLRTGVTYKKKDFSVNMQYSYISKQYTDAHNTEKSSNAIVGVIPSYYVFDISAKYQIKRYYFGLTINNFTNNKYFTRRADSYPGPGIIPSDPIQGYITLGIKI